MNMNVEKILNGSVHKVLFRAFEALKENFTQVGAMEYFLIYEKLPLSDILENSRWIFAEPIKGYSFYRGIILNHDIPLDQIPDEVEKVEEFISTNGSSMSDEMKTMYEDLLSVVRDKAGQWQNSIKTHGIYTIDEETTEVIKNAYNAKYRIRQGVDVDSNTTTLNNFVFNATTPMRIIDALILLTDVPATHYCLLETIKKIFTITSDFSIEESYEIKSVIIRILRDQVLVARVRTIPNSRLRFAILEVTEYNDYEELEKLTTECVYDFDAIYSSPENSINKVFEDDYFSDVLKDTNDQEKLKRLQNEKAVVDNNLLFMTFDLMTADDKELDKAYTNALVDYYLTDVSGDDVSSYPTTLESKIDFLLEKSTELGEQIEVILEFENKGKASKVIEGETDEKIKDAKPEKKPFFQSIQNKALDANVKFKKKVAGGSKTGQEAKNAVKAVVKIPENITDAVTKQIKEWDDMDDNRRKAYIIKPGFRKKYFRALRLALTHYAAFLVNPLLNVVVFMCQYLSSQKDARIRNELLVELNSEIKICEEKVADANANGETKKKYELMRIKDKLSAEVARVNANSRYI